MSFRHVVVRALAPALLLSVPLAVAASPPASAAGGVPVEPTRILDTRSGTGGHAGKLAPGEVLAVGVAGQAGVPGDAAGVALNLTVTEPDGSGYLTAFPCGGTVPPTSSVNVQNGATAAATVLVGVGSGGRVCLRGDVRAHVVVDVTAAFPAGGAFTALAAPARLVDSRAGLGAPARPLNAREVLRIPVAGRAGAPAHPSSAVLTLTATQAGGSGYVTAYPCDRPVPLASNVNVATGQTVANGAVVPVAADGSVCVLASVTTHLVVDLTGTMAGGSFSAVTPVRMLDTRTGVGAPAGRRGWFAGPRTELAVTGRNGVPSGPGSVVLNLTVTEPDDSGYVAAWPCDRKYTGTSAVNFVPGQTVANLAVVRAGNDGRVCLFVYTMHGGTAHVVADAAGWLPGPQAPADTRFGFVGISSQYPLPDALCAANVRPAAENKRMDVAANHTPGAPHAVSGQPALLARATGGFVGTTDEILQWNACKWGVDEDVVRAWALVESWWQMSYPGDYTSDASQCSPTRRGKLPCAKAIGLMQLWYTWFADAWPDIERSTAYNVDVSLALWRACLDGDLTYLNGLGYHAGDAWGCIARHNTGTWGDPRGDVYLGKINDAIANRTWEKPEFQEP